MSKITVELIIDGEELGNKLSVEQAADLIDDIMHTVCDYELDQAVFRLVSKALVETALDRFADADRKLEIDEMIKGFVEDFREALHGSRG